MKKALQFFLFFGLAALTNQAQNPTIVSGYVQDNQFPDAKGMRILGGDASGYYTISTKGPITDQEALVEHFLPEFEWVDYISIKGATGTTIDSKMHRQTLLHDGKVLTFHDRWVK